MTGKEEALFFSCQREALLGICHTPAKPLPVGVLIVVGGPQYRVGSHRQFVLLARHLATKGIPVFRFDFRGMGDSSGDLIDFERIGPDIRAAIDIFLQQIPQLEKIVLWGLCDGASAAMMYSHTDPRICSQILLNPWVRTEEGISKVYLKNYYLKRLCKKEFWKKIFQGKFSYSEALSGFSSILKKAFGHSAVMQRNDVDLENIPFTVRMLIGMEKFTGRSLFVLSGNDFTADEFRRYVKSSPRWCAVMEQDLVTISTLMEANHTFSKAQWRNHVETICSGFITERILGELNG